MKIGIACGGTGGHIFPGIVVARVLEGRGHSVALWICGRDSERGALAGWNRPVVRIRSDGLPSQLSARSLVVAFGFMAAIVSSRRRMKECRPDVLLAMGSYASVGPVVAARSLGIPVVLHEANAVPGRAVSLLSRLETVVALTFTSAASSLPGRRTVTTGFPVREDLDACFGRGELASDAFTVLVMGGSQGAHRLNEVVTAAVCRLHREGTLIRVLHLSGSADELFVENEYERAGVPHVVFSFLKEMGKAYNAADLAICRAGAATCMELAACGVPSLLVPLPSARRDHQAANACRMQMAGAADVVAEKDLSPESLAEYIGRARRDSGKRDEMKLALEKIASPGAAGRIANLVEQEGAGKTS